jgi:hypothetical protein
MAPNQQLSLRSPLVKGGLFVFLAITILYSLLSVSSPSGATIPSLDDIRAKLGVGNGAGQVLDTKSGGKWDAAGGAVNDTRRANAAFVILAKNSDVWGVLESMRGIEGSSHPILVPLCSAS